MTGGVGVGAGGTFQAPSFKLTRVQKIACAPASGQPGYVCDYVLGYESNLKLPPSAQSMLRNGTVSQGRFVRMGGSWQILPSNS
jgi:hypothetical protein